MFDNLQFNESKVWFSYVDWQRNTSEWALCMEKLYTVWKKIGGVWK